MATGLYPVHNGLVNNAFYAADLDEVYSSRDGKAVANPAFTAGSLSGIRRNGKV